jgi:hypothetical protein
MLEIVRFMVSTSAFRTPRRGLLYRKVCDCHCFIFRQFPAVTGRSRNEKSLDPRDYMLEMGTHPVEVDCAIAPVVCEERAPQPGDAGRKKLLD